jgi:dolichyl-phosphate beta-glucosyltransferase
VVKRIRTKQIVEERIAKFFDDSLPHLQERSKRDPKFTYEIIVVDDASKEKTIEKALEYAAKYSNNIRILKLQVNRGKGGAIRRV